MAARHQAVSSLPEPRTAAAVVTACVLTIPFALLPVLGALTGHIPVLAPDWLVLTRTALTVAAGAACLCALCIWLGAAPRVAGPALAAGFGLFGQYPVLQYAVVRGLPPTAAAVTAICYLLACVALTAFILYRRPRRGAALYQIVNTGAVIIAVLVIVHTWRAYGPRDASASARSAELDVVTAERMERTRPDVYHIILDGFGRPDVLRIRYGLDLSPIIGELGTRGFEIAANGVANYAQTYLSLASLLNAQYLQELMGAEIDPVSRRPLFDLIERSAVIATFKRLGYEFQLIGSGYSATAKHPLADLCDCDYPVIGEFESVLLQMTPFGDMGLGGVDHVAHRNKVRRSLHALESLKPTPRPRYLLAHIMAPHPPFVFGADGSDLRPSRVYALHDGSDYQGSESEYRHGYHDQAQYIASRLLSAIDRLSEVSRAQGRESIVIVQGDHGPRFGFDGDDAVRTDAAEVVPILLAIRWPAGQANQGEPAVVSPVNIYRALFRREFGAPVASLPDRSFVSSFKRPYEFIEVAPAALAPAGPGAPSQSADTISPAERSVTAANVSVPLVQPAVGNVGEPTTKRLP